MFIPENEFELLFSRSGGKGGQNVNKTSTRVQLKWNIGRSVSFSDEEKSLLRENLKNRLTTNDELIISVDEERSQFANRERAISRLESLVENALIRKKKRKATKRTFASHLKRLDSKRKISQKKRGRKMIE